MGSSGKCEQQIKSSSTVSEAFPEDKIAAMEHKLEEYIDIVISTFRPLTASEKHKLRKLAIELPARNMERIAEIIARNKPLDVDSCDEIHVDLENENKVTLWRLYYYVEAVQNARNEA